MCDKPLTGTVDAGPAIVDVLRASQRAETVTSTLRDVFLDLAFPETASAHSRHGISYEPSPAAYRWHFQTLPVFL
jgi:hypothetical protein